MRSMLIVALALVLLGDSSANAQEPSPEFKAQLAKTAAARRARNQAKNRSDRAWRDNRVAEAQALAQARAAEEALMLQRITDKVQQQKAAGTYGANANRGGNNVSNSPSSYYGQGPTGYQNGLNGPGTYYGPGGSNSQSGYNSGGKHYEYGKGPDLKAGRKPGK
jgi:hypothetical protein